MKQGSAHMHPGKSHMMKGMSPKHPKKMPMKGMK